MSDTFNTRNTAQINVGSVLAARYYRKNFSILGDSISTLEGYNPPGYNLFYTGDACVRSGVRQMADTWWGQLIGYCKANLLVNNSRSGSRVTKLPDSPSLFPSGCSDERTGGLHRGNIMPDVIIVYLGTNDWARAVYLKSSDCPGSSPTSWHSAFDSAYDAMLKKLKHNYPAAEIWCCTLCKTFMSSRPSFVFPDCFGGTHIEKFNDVIRSIAKSNNCGLIDLYSHYVAYDAVDGSHPNTDGMKTLFGLFLEEFTKNITVRDGLTAKTQVATERTECCDEAMILEIPELKKRLEIKGNRVSVGRKSDCNLYYDATGNYIYNYVARRQADFLYDGKRWYLRDNESSNGTFINGERIEPDKKYHLHYGDEIRFAFCEKIIIRKKL